MEKDNQMLVTMTYKELDDLIYFNTLRATKRALDNHFKGLLPFFNLIQDQQETMIREIDYMKLLLQERNIEKYEDEEE
jgi:hypothetical protein